MMNTLPKAITPAILRFCAQISPFEPLFIESEPTPDAQYQTCFDNSHRRVASQGGAIEYGWAIWHMPDLYFEAEHHGVWRDPTGALRDVSPQINGNQRILFLPDPLSVYDPVKQRPNILSAASDSLESHDFARLCNERNAIFIRYQIDEFVLLAFSDEDQARVNQIDARLSAIYDAYMLDNGYAGA